LAQASHVFIRLTELGENNAVFCSGQQ